MDGIPFETERLYFRALQKEDLDEIMEIWGDEEVMAWSGGAGTREQEERSLSFYRTIQKERGFSVPCISKGNGRSSGRLRIQSAGGKF